MSGAFSGVPGVGSRLHCSDWEDEVLAGQAHPPAPKAAHPHPWGAPHAPEPPGPRILMLPSQGLATAKCIHKCGRFIIIWCLFDDILIKTAPNLCNINSTSVANVYSAYLGYVRAR